MRSLLTEMDRALVHRALVLSPNWDCTDSEAETAVQLYPDRFRRILSVRLDAPALVNAGSDSGVVAWRASFWRPSTRTWLTDGTADWVWARAEAAGIPVMCFVPGGVRGLAPIAARYPDLRLAIDHMGLSLEGAGTASEDVIEDLTGLAQYPNVSVKASALPAFASETYPFVSMHEKFRRVIDAFGAHRVFWGSDLSRLQCPYGEVVDLFRAALPMSDDERSWVLGRGLADWTRWPPPSEGRSDRIS